MPRYRNEFGVVVNLPEEKAARNGGLTPVQAAPPAPVEEVAPAPAPTPSKRTYTKRAANPTSES